MQLIPALDLRRGRVVRLVQGDDARRTDYGDAPEDVLAELAAAGVELVHVVDLDAVFGEEPQRSLIARLAARGRPRIELGGGLGDRAAVAWALQAGCVRVVLGSLVLRAPERFAELAAAFPAQVLPALETAGGELRVAGWREAAPDSLAMAAARLRGLPCPAVLVTDVLRDGTLAGPNLDLASAVAAASGLPALVSGGVRSLADLEAAAARPEIAGAVVGKALYEGVFSVAEALVACRGKDAVLDA